MRSIVARLAILLAALALAAPARAGGVFSDWSAVVVAGDWHAHSGGPSEAFDNARHDVVQALEHAGFEPANLRQFSVRPERYKETDLGKSAPQEIYNAMADLSAKAAGGCLIYFSSHGARPTVVIISACFSGVFVPALAGPNRMVLTAARPDRSSFGCGEADRYPYFDQCVLESLPHSMDFAMLGRTVQGCVAARETKEGMKPPSEPQLYIGAGIKPLLPLLALSAGVRSTTAQTR